MSTIVSSEDLRRQVAAYTWAHSIDLGGGLVTPGAWGRPSPLIVRALSDVDFRGKKVLDVGCWDGLWSFEAEKRGAAEVHASDDVSQRPFRDQPTFELARDILQSRVHHHPHVPVNAIEELGIADFDVVLFFGVYYHLRDPLTALAKLRRVMRPGALLLIEGEVRLDAKAATAEFCYRRRHKDDPSNWWLPTVPCLREWVESTYFEIEREYSSLDLPPRRPGWVRLLKRLRRLAGLQSPFGRHLFIARAVCRHDPNYLYLDRDLADFDRGAASCNATDATS